MKIFFIRANKTKYGGAENYLSRLSVALEKGNIDHQIINSIFPKFLPSWIRAILFNLQVCLLKKGKFYFSLDRISCPDVYRAGDGVHKVFLTVERKSKLNPLHPIYLFLENRCFRNAKRIIANSNMVKNEIINTYDINPANISVVYNGIELKESNYKKSFNKLSKEFKIKPNNPVLLHVGSGFKRKGVEEFLQIIAKLNNPNIIGFIVGKEKKINHYLQLARDLSIDEQVIFTGSRKDVDDFYTISDIFLFSTHYEPFSNVILEAMSFDNVVFTTKQNGASEILDDEFLMEHPNDFSVVNKINNLLNHPNLLEEVKSRNKLIVKQFSIDNNLIKTMDVIRSVMHE